MARPKSNNVQINISIPSEWKIQQLKQFYARCGILWSRGYFISTAGHISEATVIKYIEEQKKHD